MTPTPYTATAPHPVLPGLHLLLDSEGARVGTLETSDQATLNLVDAAPCLLDAARAVIAAWEGNGLAAAVRRLASVVDALDTDHNP